LPGLVLVHRLLVHDARQNEASISAALEGDARDDLDADALGFALELGVRDLDAHLGQVALGIDRVGPSGSHDRVVGPFGSGGTSC